MAKAKSSNCPVCAGQVMVASAKFPFCSDKCRLVDLGRWLNEEYSVPAPITERNVDQFERAMRDREER